MKIEIPFKHDDTKMFIYQIEIYENFTFRHVGTIVSCRNDVDDVWGHEWSDEYAKERETALEQFLEKHNLPDMYCYYEEDILNIGA